MDKRNRVNSAIIANGCVFFTTMLGANLYCYCFSKKKYYLLHIASCESVLLERPYDSMVLHGNLLFLIPFNAKYLLSFDIITHEYKYLDVQKEKGDYFSCAWMRENLLYMVSGKVGTVVVYDTIKKGVVEKIRQNISSDYIFNKYDSFFRNQYVIEENVVIIPFCNANAIMQFDCNNNSISVTRIGVENWGYSGIVQQEKKYYLIPRDLGMPIIVLNKKYELERESKVEFVDKGSLHPNGIVFDNQHPVIYYLGEATISNQYYLWKKNSMLLYSDSNVFISFSLENEELSISSGEKVLNIKVELDRNCFEEIINRIDKPIQENDILSLKNMLDVI